MSSIGVLLALKCCVNRKDSLNPKKKTSYAGFVLDSWSLYTLTHVGQDTSHLKFSHRVVRGCWLSEYTWFFSVASFWEEPQFLAHTIPFCVVCLFTKILMGFTPKTIRNQHLGVSKNNGTPKWMVKKMENPMNKWMIWGYHYFRKHPFDNCMTCATWCVVDETPTWFI